MNNSVDVLTRGVNHILPSKEGLRNLMEKRKLKVYQGFDPSMPSLHLGNIVGLMKLRQFQNLGHKVIFLVGDFTGMIGDPTDKLATRPKLSRKQILINCKRWKEQASRILKFNGNNPAEFKFNSQWLNNITFKELIEITSNFTVQQMIERDMFQERINNNKPIHLHEFLYPTAQGIDSLELEVDLEIGGQDQLFNMLAGRTLLKNIKGREKFVLTTKLLTDEQGNKVGKTTGNALFLDSTPQDFYGGIMAFPDSIIALGFELLTQVEIKSIDEKIRKNPMAEKKRLAFEIVKTLWGVKSAQESQNYFEKTFQKGSPDFSRIVPSGKVLLEIVSASVESRSEAKRLIFQGAVDVNGKVLTDQNYKVKKGDNIKIGSRIFLKAK